MCKVFTSINHPEKLFLQNIILCSAKIGYQSNFHEIYMVLSQLYEIGKQSMRNGSCTFRFVIMIKHLVFHMYSSLIDEGYMSKRKGGGGNLLYTITRYGMYSLETF